MDPAPPLDRRWFFVSMVMLLAVVLLAGSIGIYVLADRSIAQAFILARAAECIVESHESGIDHSTLIDSGRRAMFALLDRYSGYVSHDEFRRIDEELAGHYTGIGVTVVGHEQGLLVVSVHAGGSAVEAGLLPGDIIIGGDSVEFAGVDADSASRVLRGREGTPVLVRFFRQATADTIETRLIRHRISFVHVPYAGIIPESCVYVHLSDFEAGAATELRAVLDSLVGDSQSSLRGIILDLRGNPGGLFEEAYKVADLFLKHGTFIVGTEARSRWDEKRCYATGDDVTGGLPLVVLVDRGTASSSEIVAGALREAGRAVLVGDTTFGKGLVQRIVRYADGDGIRLTMARYYLDHGVGIGDFDSVRGDSGHGLAPDYYLPSEKQWPFLQALENSFLMYQFAGQFQDEIAGVVGSQDLGDEWVRRLAAFCRCHGFVYRSLTTRLADSLAALLRREPGTLEMGRWVERIAAFSQEVDDDEFEYHENYIKRRLKQIALQRVYGPLGAYREVVMRDDPALQKAREILRGSS